MEAPGNEAVALPLPHIAKIDNEHIVALEQGLPGFTVDFFDLGSGRGHKGCSGMLKGFGHG
jgi:hypothetical protein